MPGSWLWARWLGTDVEIVQLSAERGPMLEWFGSWFENLGIRPLLGCLETGQRRGYLGSSEIHDRCLDSGSRKATAPGPRTR